MQPAMIGTRASLAACHCIIV